MGAITAANRIFMAPLTRLRSIEPGDIPTPLMAEYYRQRASAGLIISEATQDFCPGKRIRQVRLASIVQEQIAAWKKITAGVHAENGHMAVQPAADRTHFSRQPATWRSGTGSAFSTSARDHVLLCAMENGQAMRVETSMPRALELGEIPGYRQ